MASRKKAMQKSQYNKPTLESYFIENIPQKMLEKISHTKNIYKNGEAKPSRRKIGILKEKTRIFEKILSDYGGYSDPPVPAVFFSGNCKNSQEFFWELNYSFLGIPWLPGILNYLEVHIYFFEKSHKNYAREIYSSTAWKICLHRWFIWFFYNCGRNMLLF